MCASSDEILGFHRGLNNNPEDFTVDKSQTIHQTQLLQQGQPGPYRDYATD